MSTELVPYIFEGELLDGTPDCQVAYEEFCSGEDVQLVELDPDDNPGLTVWVCAECYEEMCYGL